ncbi:MAG: hypothetical protein WDN72_05625 [Alphaproteobacteria bacterium]
MKWLEDRKAELVHKYNQHIYGPQVADDPAIVRSREGGRGGAQAGLGLHHERAHPGADPVLSRLLADLGQKEPAGRGDRRRRVCRPADHPALAHDRLGGGEAGGQRRKPPPRPPR